MMFPFNNKPKNKQKVQYEYLYIEKHIPQDIPQPTSKKEENDERGVVVIDIYGED